MEIIDLSISLEDGMLTYPTSSHHRFESSILGRLAIEGRETRKFTMGSHCGTHVDAMRHFIDGGVTADELPLDSLVGPAELINLSPMGAGTLIEVDDLVDQLPEKVDRVVIRTDWSQHWGTSQYYSNWPSLSGSCTELLIERGIKLLGIDFPSPDLASYGHDCSIDSPNHKKLFEKNVVLVEYLNNLKLLRSGGIFLMVLPLKLIGFDGAPARVAAYSTNNS